MTTIIMAQETIMDIIMAMAIIIRNKEVRMEVQDIIMAMEIIIRNKEEVPMEVQDIKMAKEILHSKEVQVM